MKLFYAMVGIVTILSSAMIVAVDIIKLFVFKNEAGTLFFGLYFALEKASFKNPLLDTIILYCLPTIIGALCLIALLLPSGRKRAVKFFGR